ncbi:multiple sugar transport system permease protein [Paenibacillus methanolicus]|uniref:Multiple sugar transport system permease protein n=1 Tax=Paenibacillus methanolicus TaxID=582686 RepID=A0A5S5CJ46_9BACL|nr:multiple sugar transport system permease protein [Paenibacillus methanolicus]
MVDACRKGREGFNRRKGLLTVFMFAISILFLLPFIWMLATSFKVE